MANNCCYQLRVASKTRKSVEQFVNALKYKDMERGYYMCRIFSAECPDGVLRDGEYYYADVSGDCAWSVRPCMIETEYGEWRGIEYMEPKFQVYRDLFDGICYENIGVTAPMLCRLLGCGVEIWSDEAGYGFQEHYLIAPDGGIAVDDTVDWRRGWDEDREEPDPNLDEGGFEDFGCFETPEAIARAGDDDL